jgi:hypothetical protein
VELEAKELLLLMHLGMPKLKHYIQANRSEFDALCSSRGLKRSLIIENLVEKNPLGTLDELMAQAKQPTPVRFSVSSSSSSSTPDATPPVKKSNCFIL